MLSLKAPKLAEHSGINISDSRGPLVEETFFSSKGEAEAGFFSLTPGRASCKVGIGAAAIVVVTVFVVVSPNTAAAYTAGS